MLGFGMKLGENNNLNTNCRSVVFPAPSQTNGSLPSGGLVQMVVFPEIICRKNVVNNV